MIRPEQMPYKNPMDKTYDSGNFASVLDQALDARRLERVRGAARGVEQARTTARTRDGGVSRMDRRRRVRGAGDGHRVRPTATSRSFRRRRRWGRASRRPSRNSRSTCSTSRSRRSGSSRAIPIAEPDSAARDRARCSSADRRSRSRRERTVQKAQDLAAAALEAAATDIEYAEGAFTVTGTDRRIGLFELARRQPQQQIRLVSVSSVAGPDVAERLPHLRSGSRSRHGSRADRRLRVGERRRPRRQSADRDRATRRRRRAGDRPGAVRKLRLRRRVGPGAHRHASWTTRLPRSSIVADFRTTMDESTPCLNNAMGVKGVGELGTIGATPAVVNAVIDALARAGVAGRWRARCRCR